MLSVSGLQSAYGPSQVLFDVELRIKEGEVVTLLGRNGAGKTTTLKAIMGLAPARSGSIRLDGRELTGLPPHEVPKAGIAYVPQGRRLFAEMTVAENIEIGLMARGRGKAVRERVLDLFPLLRQRLRQRSGTLSGGEQQMLAIGRALLTNPRLLILDEATEGLAPVIRHEIWACLNQLKAEGQTILLIDKNLKEMQHLVDRHYMIEKGRVMWHGSSQELLERPELVDRYLGV